MNEIINALPGILTLVCLVFAGYAAGQARERARQAEEHLKRALAEASVLGEQMRERAAQLALVSDSVKRLNDHQPEGMVSR